MQVVIVTTCFICNALPICSLTAGVAAIYSVRPFGRECTSTHLADLGEGRLGQAPLYQLLFIADIAAFFVIAVFLGPDFRVEIASTALANDFANRSVFPVGPASYLSLIAILQDVLVLVLPVTVPHEISTSFVMEIAGRDIRGPLRYKLR